MKYHGLLLDFYGTIVSEDDQVVAEISGEIAVTSDLKVSQRDVANYWWTRFSALTQRCHAETFITQREVALTALEETVCHFGSSLEPAKAIERQFTQWRSPDLFPYAVRFLNFVSRMSIPICIVSNIDRTDLQIAMLHHDLGFANIVTSDDVGAYKPDRDIFSAAVGRLGLDKGHVLHIGDSRTSDVAGAIDFGLDVAWLNRTKKADMSGRGPTYTAPNFDVLAGKLGLYRI